MGEKLSTVFAEPCFYLRQLLFSLGLSHRRPLALRLAMTPNSRQIPNVVIASELSRFERRAEVRRGCQSQRPSGPSCQAGLRRRYFRSVRTRRVNRNSSMHKLTLSLIAIAFCTGLATPDRNNEFSVVDPGATLVDTAMRFAPVDLDYPDLNPPSKYVYRLRFAPG